MDVDRLLVGEDRQWEEVGRLRLYLYETQEPEGQST